MSQKTVQNLQSDGFTGTQVAQYNISDLFKGSMTVNDGYLYITATEGFCLHDLPYFPLTINFIYFRWF